MASIEIDRREFFDLLGKEMENQRIIEEASFMGVHWHGIDGNVCDVETYPNRPDCLSVEGLARAYRGFFGIETGLEDYTVENGDIEVEVDESVEEVRPYIGCAVVRGLDLSKKKINALIQLQEKLHETMGRKRDKLAIGLHDLSTVEAPFTYKAVEPEQVSFKPLEYDRHMQLGEILDEHEKGQEYAWILEDEDRYPIIEDSEGKVLSFPPIINNQLTEVDSNTQDIFIDVTGKHEETVRKVLNILTTALAERGGDIGSVEVEGEKMPELSPEEMELDTDYVNQISGLDLLPEEVVERLEKMKHGAKRKKDVIKVKVPAYRTDVMHQYDLIEDVVIAHGYDNIEPEVPEVDQDGSLQDITELSDMAREVLRGKGALEAFTHALSSEEKLFDKMKRDVKGKIELENALTEDYSTLRTWLLPSLLEVLKENKHRSYPQEFFETADVAILDDSATGSSNRRKLAYVVSDTGVDYTDAKKTLQVLERDLGIELEVEADEKPYARENRSAEISMNGRKIGVIAEISEEVLKNWELKKPVAAFELNLEKINQELGNLRLGS